MSGKVYILEVAAGETMKKNREGTKKEKGKQTMLGTGG